MTHERPKGRHGRGSFGAVVPGEPLTGPDPFCRRCQHKRSHHGIGRKDRICSHEACPCWRFQARRPHLPRRRTREFCPDCERGIHQHLGKCRNLVAAPPEDWFCECKGGDGMK